MFPATSLSGRVTERPGSWKQEDSQDHPQEEEDIVQLDHSGGRPLWACTCPGGASLHRIGKRTLLRQGSGALPWRATDLARVTREALGHRMEACFEARFPQEGARQGDPDPQEFVSKAIQELQESRVMRGSRRLSAVAPPSRRGRWAAHLHRHTRGQPRRVSGAPLAFASGCEGPPTGMFACLMACRARLQRASAS